MGFRSSNMLSPSYPYAKNGFAARHGSMLDYSRDGDPMLLEIAAANHAYSLRYLSPDYTGPVVRIRRDNDNAEANFTPDEILDTTLTTWVGANEGHVVTWFDQSGNGYDATQATATAQPKLVTGGNVILLNGLPAVRNSVSANGVGLTHASGVFDLAQPNQSILVAAHNDATGSTQYAFGGNNLSKRNDIFKSNTDQDINIQGTTPSLDSNVTVSTSQQLINGLFNGASSAIRVDTVETTGNAGVASNDGVVIFNAQPLASANNWLGYIQEAVFFPADVSASNDALENNINAYYSTY